MIFVYDVTVHNFKIWEISTESIKVSYTPKIKKLIGKIKKETIIHKKYLTKKTKLKKWKMKRNVM